MGRKDGGGRSSGGNPDFRHRIEGFGNTPMPPPISDSFEDRLHNALSNDETVGSWYTSALAAVDSMVTTFDDNVNAIFDSIEETVEAIVGDDDPPYEPENRRSNENQRERRRNEQDDGERSGTNWQDKVGAICEEGDLENFVLMVRSQCANAGEEKEVGGLLAQELLLADKPSAALRVLYVMQAVEEGDLPAALGVIREKCADKLEQLKSQTLCRSLANQILGPGRPAGSSSTSASQETKETKAQEEEKPKAKPKPKPKPTDLLDFGEPAPKPQVKPPEQKAKAKPAAKASAKASTAPADLLDDSPPPATTGPLDLLDMASPAPLLAPQTTGDLMTLQVAQPSTASTASGFTPSPDPFGTFQSSLPTTAQTTAQPTASWAAFGSPAPAMQSQFPNMATTGMRPQGFGSGQAATSSVGYMGGVQFPNSMNSFDPNPKTIPGAIANGPAMPMMSGVTTGPTAGADWSALSNSGFSSGMKPAAPLAMGGTSAPAFGSGRSATQAAVKKDLQLDDVLSNELAKMQSVS